MIGHALVHHNARQYNQSLVQGQKENMLPEHKQTLAISLTYFSLIDEGMQAMNL